MYNSKLIWKFIKDRKQNIIKQNNQRENSKRIKHVYETGHKVLWRVDLLSKYGTIPYKGPYKVLKVNTNGTVRIQMENYSDVVNIRLLHPYKE